MEQKIILEIKNKTKDELPFKTVHRIRSILHRMNIFTSETWFDSGIDGCHSLRVNIEKTVLGQNGKGATCEFALASGYAELIERLANDLIYVGDYSKEARDYLNFNYAPDEKYLNAADLLSNGNSWIDKIISGIVYEKSIEQSNFSFLNMFEENSGKIDSRLDAVKSLSFLLPEGFDKSEFICLPFYDIKNKNLQYIPFSILKTFYGSNGTCAGNNPHEAIVQGLSEIIERHVNIKIIKDKIVPPDIPDNYLMKFDRIYQVIKMIEEKGPYKIIVKDCSLNKKYPVVCVILINKQFQTYRVKFGAHPVIEIALERSLTELLQGVEVYEASKSSPFYFGESMLEMKNNLQNIIKTGFGSYPDIFFSDEYDYDFKGFESSKADNKELLNELLSKLFKEGHDIFIRNNSFLGFNSFQIIIPGLSEIYSYDLLKVKEKKSHDRVRRIMRNLHEASDEELKTLAIFINYKFYYLNENTASYLYGLPLKNNFFGINYSLNLLLAFVQYKLGNLNETCNEINAVIGSVKMKKEKLNNPEITKLKCIKDYIAMEIDNISNDDKKSVLVKFYPDTVVAETFDLLADKNKVFNKIYKKSNCFDCSDCEMNSDCTYKEVEKIYLKVKEMQINNPINQVEDMEGIF